MKRLLITLTTALVAITAATAAIAMMGEDERSVDGADAEDEVALSAGEDDDAAEPAAADAVDSSDTADDEPVTTTEAQESTTTISPTTGTAPHLDNDETTTVDAKDPESDSGTTSDASSDDSAPDVDVLGTQESAQLEGAQGDLAQTGRSMNLVLLGAALLGGAGVAARGAEMGLRRLSRR